MNKNIQEAITIFNQGGIVIFPTDTAFGIGCRVDKTDTIKRLYEIRKRPITQPMSLLVNGLEMSKRYVLDIPHEVQNKLIDPFWPGALTVVLSANKTVVPSMVRADGETIGLRMPNHDEVLSIISSVDVAILGPSANFHGEKTPFTLADLNPDLIRKVDYVLEGSCKHTLASTVIDCTVTPWEILRQGAIRL